LVQLFSLRASIPDHYEFPGIRPRLESYGFPHGAVDWLDFDRKAQTIRQELNNGLNSGKLLTYRAPWRSLDNIPPTSVDLLLSQAVLQYFESAEQIQEIYRAMFGWLRSGGYASHAIRFSETNLSPYWNGHWAYSNWEWKLACGRRQSFLSREPLSTHLESARKAGFELLVVDREYNEGGLAPSELTSRFQRLNSEDLGTRGCMLILRKN